MTETWFKILEELESPYTGSQRLEDQLHALLIKGETYTLQKADQFKTEIELLAKIIVAHQDYVLKHGFFSDMFGDYMEQAGKLNSGTGQFLTPTCITEMMAQIVFGSNDFERIQVFGDPASGTGRFMLQTAKLYAEKTGKLNFLYVNTDIDFRAYVYCVMNAMLNRIPSITCWGNSLSLEYSESIWVLPVFSWIHPSVEVTSWHRLNGEETKQAVLRFSRFAQEKEVSGPRTQQVIPIQPQACKKKLWQATLF